MFDAQLGHLARSLVLATLSQVQNGRLTLILNDQKDSETLHFGKQSPEFPDATVTVHDERVWLAMCINMDLVDIILTHFQRLLLMKTRDSAKVICRSRLIAII